jgi:hypothetical protein
MSPWSHESDNNTGKSGNLLNYQPPRRKKTGNMNMGANHSEYLSGLSHQLERVDQTSDAEKSTVSIDAAIVVIVSTCGAES